MDDVGGSIRAILTLDRSDYIAGLKAAGVEADELGRHNPTINIEVKGAARAIADLKTVDETEKRVGNSGRQAGQGMGALGTAIALVGPAIVPLAAGATGLAVGFGAMGAAGLLAIGGIKRAMDNGTVVGKAYSTGLKTMVGDLHTLQDTAARGVLASFTREVASLGSQMPFLNRTIGEFSVLTGKTAANLAGGLISSFRVFEPLARDVGNYIFQLSGRFQALMASNGATGFADYIRSVFPQVASTIESLVTTVSHLIAGFAPLGGGVLSEIRLLSDLIGAIPVGVLQVMAQLAGPVFIGFKAWQGISAIVSAASISLEGMGRSAGIAAAGVRGLEIAAGPLGIGLAALSFIIGHNAETSRQAQQAANDYADALKASNGVVNDSIRLKTIQMLTDDGLLAKARELGLNLADVTSAAMGNADALASLNDQIAINKSQLQGQVVGTSGATGAMARFNSGVHDLRDGIGQNNKALQTGIQIQRDQKAAMTDSTGATIAAATEAQKQATIVANASQAVRDYTVAHESSTGATKEETSAINALNTAIDTELGKALALAGSQTAVDSATLDVVTALKKNKGAMSEHSAAGVDDRRKIEGVVSALQRHRDVLIQNGTPITTATKQYQDGSKALLDQIGKLNGTKSAAYKYAAQLLAIPKGVGTKIGLTGLPAAQGGLSKIQHMLDTLPTTKVINILVANGSSVAAATSQVGQSNRASQHTAQADGGFYPHGVRAMADGGTARESVIMRAQSPILWNEAPGGEAYVSLAPAKRSRSKAIVRQIEEEFGMGGDGIDYSRLAQAVASAMSGVVLRPTISAGSVDRAVGATL